MQSLGDADANYVWLSSATSPPFTRHEHTELCAPTGGTDLCSLIRVRTIQQNFRPDVSIGLLRDRIGHQPWPLASTLP